MAKTQYSLTDDATKLGAPTDFDVTVRNLKISAGAGFIVALTGDIMTMPGNFQKYRLLKELMSTQKERYRIVLKILHSCYAIN